MSYASVFASATSVLLANVPTLVTVKEQSQLDTVWVQPNLCPAVLLSDRTHSDTPLGNGSSDRVWWLDCALWAYYQVDQDTTPFNQLREQVELALRSHTWLDRAADDPTFNTQLYASGRNIQVFNKPTLPTGMGQVVRRCTISSLVREAVYFAAV
jgi:hypothetical protein